MTATITAAPGTLPAPDAAATPTPAPPASRPRLTALDGLRFVAAAAVVVYHLTARRSTAWGDQQQELLADAGRWTSLGSLGPALFFVISGFVLAMSAWGRSAVHVVASRVARLYPAYWVCVLATGGLLLLLWPEGKAVTGGQVLANLTMVQPLLGVEHVDGVYWTLWTELRFYLLMVVFALIGLTRRRVLVVAAVWPVLALAVEAAGWQAAATWLVSDYAPLFAAGMALYVLHRDGHAPLAWAVVAVDTALAVARVVPSREEVLTRVTGIAPSTTELAAGVVLCVAAVAVVTLTRVARWDMPLLVAAGALTYPLYLVHQYWGLYVVDALVGRAPAPVVVATAALVVLALAWVVNRVVEVPCGPLLRRAVTTGLERPRDAVLDAVNRGPRILAGAGRAGAPSRPAQGVGRPPTGPGGCVPLTMASQNAGESSSSRSTVEPTSPGR